MNSLEQLLMTLYEAQKMKGTNAIFEMADAIDKHLTKACRDFDEMSADLEWYRENAGKMEVFA